MLYRREHSGQFRALRQRGERLFSALDPAERKRLASRASTRAGVIFGRIEKLSRRFKNPKLALRMIQPLIVTASPRPPKPGAHSLLPRIPDLPGAPTRAR